MIRIVTDSGAMLPDGLRRRYEISVIPMTIAIDGHEFAEGSDVSNAEFYSRLRAGASVSTSAPSPGAFVDAYQRAADDGATAVLSIHTGSAYSATVSAASLAAELADLEVTVIDTGVASFPVSLCVWAAGDQLMAGGAIQDAAAAARATAERTGSLFIVGVPELARRGGRFVSIDGVLTPTTVIELVDGELRQRGTASDVEAAIDMMAEHTKRLARQRTLRVGVGHAGGESIAELLVARLTDQPGIVDVIEYGVGPSVGAHTGWGTVGVVYAPVEPLDVAPVPGSSVTS